MIFINNITYQELANFQKKRTLLIDLRPYKEYLNFHIPNSFSIHQLPILPKDKSIIFICEHGLKAKEYADYYRYYHYDCYYLEGGISLYKTMATQHNFY